MKKSTFTTEKTIKKDFAVIIFKNSATRYVVNVGLIEDNKITWSNSVILETTNFTEARVIYQFFCEQKTKVIEALFYANNNGRWLSFSYSI